MPSISSSEGAEQAIVDALVEKAASCSRNQTGLWGNRAGRFTYNPSHSGAVGKSDRIQSPRGKDKSPTSIHHQCRSENFSEQTTSELLSVSPGKSDKYSNPMIGSARKPEHTALNDTRFDIAPSRGQLSFADNTLTVETII